MTVVRFPYGYKPDANGVLGMGTMLTRAQLELTTTVKNLHPEFWRRAIAMMEFADQKGVPLGVGTGWRADQPNLPGFAPSGNSNHQGFAPGGKWACAIDFVPAPSWPWMFDNCGIFGLRTFRDVNDEPWHGQPIEIPPGRNWRVSMWDLSHWNLPGDEGDDDMPLSNEDIDKIADAVWAKMIDTSPAAEIEAQPARFFLHRTYLILQQCLGSFNGRPPPTETMLERIDKNTR